MCMGEPHFSNKFFLVVVVGFIEHDGVVVS